MFKTKPAYILADNLTIKQFYRYVFLPDLLTFSSKRLWWRKTTLFCLPLVLAMWMLVGLVVIPQDAIGPGGDIHWSYIFLALLPAVVSLSGIWIETYYKAFTKPEKSGRKIESFIRRNIPDASDLRRISPVNYILTSGDLEFEVCLTIGDDMSVEGRKREAEFMVVAVYCAPRENFLQGCEDCRITQSLRDDWDAYCEGKVSCRNLVLTDNSMFAVFRPDADQTDGDVAGAVEQMRYLLGRLDLIPLRLVID